MSDLPGERWFEAAFRADYLRVYPHRDLAAAGREVDFLLARGIGGAVLDLCCGFGRHTLLLRQRGVSAFGLDLSFDLLRHARSLEGFERSLAGRILRADAVRVPFRDASFDGVVNLFSSFGYFGAENDVRVLGEVARVSKRGARGFFDLMNPALVRATLVRESRRSGDGFELVERRALEDDGRRVVKKVELAIGGATRRWTEDVRMYELGEFRALAERAGLRVEAVFGDFDARGCDEHAPRQIVETRRA